MYRKTIRAGEISRKRQEVAHGRGRTIQVPLYTDSNSSSGRVGQF